MYLVFVYLNNKLVPFDFDTKKDQIDFAVYCDWMHAKYETVEML